MKTEKLETCSVVLSTYNGEKYIIEQLESIRIQKRKPEEVLICDDCSTDNTPVLVKNYIKSYKLNWFFFQNKSNKGFFVNFINLVKQASGSVIFFCDQDDIWKDNKIDDAMNFLRNNSSALAVSCNVNFIDGAGNRIEAPQLSYLNVSEIHKVALPEIIRIPNSLGCTMAFRKNLVENIDDYIMLKGASHDSLIEMIAILKGEMYKIPQIGMNYRVHENNTSHLKKNQKNREDEVENNLSLLKKIEGEMHKNGLESNPDLLNAIILLKRRIDFFEKETNIISQVLFIPNYIKYANGILAGIRLFLGDVMFVSKGKKI